MKRDTLLAGLALAVAVVFCGCDGCGGSSPLSIAITTAPPASMEVNQTANMTATVSNDGANGGVDWSCTPVGTCGTFTPAHTASGAATQYQAPPASANVVITAASTTKPAVNKTANVTINPVGTAANLNGTYTFFANGWDNLEAPISVVGSVVLDGAGHVTGGEQDWFDLGTFDNIVTTDAITLGGTVTVGSDGRGTLSLNTTSGLNESFSITLVNSKHLLITQFDGNATSSGSLDLQTAPTSVPTGGLAMTTVDTAEGLVFGGIESSDGSSGIALVEGDEDFQGGVDSGSCGGDTFTAPDSHGRGEVTICGNLFSYYVVGPEVFRLVETDANFFLAGSMYGQGTAAGGFSAASLAGNFIFGESGEEFGGTGLFAAAGQFTATSGTGTLTGVADINEGDGAPVLAGDLTGSTYALDANGRGAIALPGTTTDTIANFGVYMVDPTLDIVDPNSASGGGGALMLDLDSNNFGAGIIVPKSASPTFSGNYALNQDAFFVTDTTSGFYDLIGQVFSDGTSTLTGKGDLNTLSSDGVVITTTQNANVTVTGTYAADGTHAGRATAQLTVNGAALPNQITAYQASSALLLHVDVDSPDDGIGTVGLGVLEKQQ